MRRHHDPIEVRLGPPHGRIARARPASSRATHRGVAGQPTALDSEVDREVDREVDQEVDRADDRGPGQFIWRGRIWRVLEVESRWRESGSWWTGPAVRAARGEISMSDEGHEGDLGDLDLDGGGLGDSSWSGLRDHDSFSEGQTAGDVLCEVEVWRVEAANGRQGSRGIYDLAHSLWSGQWHLRAVFD